MNPRAFCAPVIASCRRRVVDIRIADVMARAPAHTSLVVYLRIAVSQCDCVDSQTGANREKRQKAYARAAYAARRAPRQGERARMGSRIVARLGPGTRRPGWTAG